MKVAAVTRRIIFSLTLTLFALGILSVSTAMSLSGVRPRQLARTAVEARATAAELLRNLEQPGRRSDSEEMASALRLAGSHPLADGAALIGADGIVVAASRAEWVARRAPDVLPASLIPPSGATNELVANVPDTELLVGFFSVAPGAREPARAPDVLAVAFNAGPAITAGRAEVWARQLWLTLVAVPIALAVGLTLDRLNARGADHLRVALLRITGGDDGARTNSGGGDPTRDLARALDSVSDRLAMISAERDRSAILLKIQNDLHDASAPSRPLASVLDQLCLQVEGTLNRSRCLVLESSSDGGLRVMSGPGLAPEQRAKLDKLLADRKSGFFARARGDDVPAWAGDIPTDPRWEGMREVAATLGIRACWSQSITDGDEVFGIFAISHPAPREPNDLDRALLATGARLAAIAFRRDRTLQALRESEERLRWLAETIDEAFWISTPNLDRILYVSAAYERIWGRTRESLYADPRSFIEAIHPDDRAGLLHVITPREGGFQTEYRVVRPDGSVIWVEDRGFPVRKSDGNLRAMVGCVRDINERKFADQTLQAREARFRAVLETNPDGFWMVDHEGRLTEVNEAYARRSGYSRHEMLGMQIADFEASEDQAAVVEHILKIRRDGHDRFETRHRAKDGTVWPVQVTAAYWPETGGTFAFLQDITRQREAERALRQMEFSVENFGDAVFWVSPDARILYVNEAASDRFRSTTGESEPWFLYDFDPDMSSLDWPVHWAGLKQRGSMVFERRHRLNDGRIIPVEINANYVNFDGAEFNFATARDITDRKRSEEAIRERTALLEALVDSTLDGVLVVNENGQKILQNQPLTELWKIPPEIASNPDGRVLVEFVTGRTNDPVQFAEKLARLHANPFEVSRDEIELIDGTVLDRYSGPILSATGKNHGRIWTFRDITERKRAEAALRESEARYRTVIDRAVDPLYVNDLNGRFVDVNLTACEALGYAREEFLELGITDIDPDFPPDRLASKIASFVAAPGQMMLVETRHRRRDGTVFPVEMRVGAVLLGDTLRIVGLAHDLTERKRAEAEIRALNSELERRVEERTAELSRLVTILEASPDLIAIFDARSMRATYANGAFLRMISARGMALGDLRIGNIHSPESARVVIEEGLPSAAREGIWLGETEVFGQGERLIPVSELIQSHQGPDGQIRYFSKTMRDISDRKHMEDELRLRRDALLLANADLAKAARLKDEFLASMSHELRTPLNGVLAMSEALQEEVYGPLGAEQLSALRDIEQCGRHLLSLINDILDLSKIEAGQITLEPGVVEVDSLCQSAIRLVRELAQKKRHRVSVSIDGALGSIMADERRLKQILVNLLSNAVKFTPDGGEVSLEARGDEARALVCFTVSDTGIGISESDIGLLFRPFQQIDSRLSREYSGTGLGLALVRRMVELHGGSVTVESAPGRGSRFSVNLPWRVAENAGEGGAKDARKASVRKVILVEDTPGDAEKLVRYLNELNVEALVQTGASGAIERIRRERPDVVLLDLILPDGDGWELLTTLKADPDLCHVPVVVISVVDDGNRCVRLGAAAHLLKPLDRETLRSTLGQAVRMLPGSRAVVVLPDPPAPSAPLLLMVEDNPTNARSVRDYLQSAGYRVIVTPDGFEALERARDLLPALILMDIQMPGIDGLEVIRRLRADETTRSIPVVAVTALVMPGDRERCLAAGANDYLTKPLSLVQLLELVRRHVPHSHVSPAPSV